ncbi:hypothetical protein C943_02447 [Mariniradius saccharolyticus AK6]|uniref:Uncharacterized protein n=1 Tax=Mariniradius saccharolyticus AK6 TaxID=1239962 RepID=M7X1B0_9BACT|nr:hypothetical protein C943_02447 [Mariniradius saccharolyticus AK6]
MKKNPEIGPRELNTNRSVDRLDIYFQKIMFRLIGSNRQYD